MKLNNLRVPLNRLCCVLLLFIATKIYGQNTVGVLEFNEATEEGYTLFTIHKQTYLIDNCGQVVNQWTSDYTPGNAVYLLENGDILRAGNTESEDFQFGGSGGIIERFDWDGNLVWQYRYDTDQYRQHHDIYPMPNGNVLLLATTLVTGEEAIAAGRNPDKLEENKIYNERILEITPIGMDDADIVWEWNFIDHVIQDFDSSKNNFGNVADNPQRVDINYTLNEVGGARWLHINSIQYYEALDQIVMSSRHLNEFYIIDHSTTTEEAAGTTGGIYGKGGDFLYRWGNPLVYRRGTSDDAKLGGQHYPHFIQPGLQDEGKLLVFNNFYTSSPDTSAAMILDLPQSSPGFYIIEDDMAYGPETPFFIYTNADFFSPIVSSAQRLPNGNMLLCEGRFGRISEIDPSKNIVWKYTVPVNNDNGSILSQGDDPNSTLNITFRAIKYTPDYPAFVGRELIPGDPIESNPDLSNCATLSNPDEFLNSVSIYPNPVDNMLYIDTTLPDFSIAMYDIRGHMLEVNRVNKGIDVSNLSSGVYLLRINNGEKQLTKRIIIR